MATVKKTKTAKVKTKSGSDYSYQYSDLATIDKYLEENNLAYDQHIKTETEGGMFGADKFVDYIMTQRYTVDEEGNKEPMGEPVKGLRINYGTDAKIQEFGAQITYLRRYSVLMAFGLASEDNDGQAPKAPGSTPAPKKATPPKGQVTGVTSGQIAMLKKNIDNPLIKKALTAYKKERIEDLTVKEASVIIGRLKEEHTND